MNIMFCTDIHGSSERYKKILNIHKEFDLTIIGGDILPKNIRSDSIHSVQRKFVTNFLPEYFSKFKTDLIIDFANDDHYSNYNDFVNIVSKYNHIHRSHLNSTKINNITFTGMNFVPDYPFGLKDWCRKDNDEYIINPKQISIPCTSTKSGYKNIENLEKYYNERMSIENVLDSLLPGHIDNKTICLFHSPPRTLGLDICYDRRAVGSRAVTNWILKNQPKLVLCGHIHESPKVSGIYYNYLEKTLCIQPGQSYYRDELTYCCFDLSNIEKTLEIRTI